MLITYVISLLSFCLVDLSIVERGVLKSSTNSVWDLMCDLSFSNISFFFFVFLRQGFSVVLEPVLELTLIDQAGLELTEICLCLLSAGIKGVSHYSPAHNVSFIYVGALVLRA